MHKHKHKILILSIYLVIFGGHVIVFTKGAELIRTHLMFVFRCDLTKNDTLASSTPLNANESTVLGVGILNCPAVNFAKDLRKININLSTLTELALATKALNAELGPEHMIGLNLTSLSIANYVIKDDFLSALPMLEIYDVSIMSIPKLPSTHKIRNLHLGYGNFSGEWGFCGNIHHVYMRRWAVPESSSSWLSTCPKLRSLHFLDMKLDDLQRALTGLRLVPILAITNLLFPKNIYDGEITKGVMHSFILNLTQDGIEAFTSDAFAHNKMLTILDLSSNKIDSNKLKKTNPLAKVPTLKLLILDKNPTLSDVCMSPQTEWRAQVPKISMKDIGLTSLCFGQWKGVSSLDLSNNIIQSLKFTELPSPMEGNLTVDLRNNPITIPSLTEENYNAMMEKYNNSINVTIILDPVKLDCDCKHGWLACIMRTLPLFIDNATCPTNIRLTDLPPEQIECNKYECEPCICRENFNNRSVTADCNSKELQNVPQLTNVSNMLLRYNVIDAFKPADFPDVLEFADLRNNLIANMSSETVDAIFSSPDRRILLAGNPINCTCSGLYLLTALNNHSSQVEDFSNLTCSDGRNVIDIDLDQLCLEDEEKLYASPPWMTVTFATVSFSLFTIFISYYNRKNIAIYLYSKGLCLSILSEKDIDGERDFDAFLSFCHLDDEFVTENILPGIEDYNLCIHYRDWVGGEWIPRQIAESIARSHRTIVVLSRNFVDSSWGMLEFRQAHAAMLKEGCRRLITIVIDDVTQDPYLDAELQGYLSSNTYLKWGDPWFFKKLRYALPRKNEDSDEDDTYGIEMDNLRAASENYRPRRMVITGNYDRDYAQNTCNQLVLVT